MKSAVKNLSGLAALLLFAAATLASLKLSRALRKCTGGRRRKAGVYDKASQRAGKAFLQSRSFTRPVENPQLPSCRKCVCLCAYGQDPISKHCHGPGRVLFSRAESFFESRGSEHLVSENASTQESPSLLPIFIVDDDANQRRPSAAGACKPNRRTDASRVCSRIRSTKHDHSRRLARRKTSSVLVRVSR
jgi:hypothetical protein